MSSPPKISWHFHFPVLGHHLPFPLMLLNLLGSGHLLRFKYLGFLIQNSIFQHYWIYYSTFKLALRCIAPFSKDYSLAFKVHNTLLLRLLLSLQVASNSGTRALPPYFEICSFTCYIALGVNGLPVRGYWQTVYIYRERSANNLLLADHTVCQ